MRTDGRRLETLLARLEDELPAAIALRRRLHGLPELAHREERTSATIVGALEGRADVVLGTAVLVRRGGGGGPPVIARAELDGLPIQEQTGAPFSATNGAMHACGHDVHMAALVALCRALERTGEPCPAPLIAVFQPSEEAYPSGADQLVAAGALPPARGVVAAHVHPGLPGGVVSAAPGPVNASCDYVTVTVRGTGGHAAYPHLVHDPVLALSAIVVAAQHIVSRRTDPTRAAVVALTCLRAGETENIVPATAEARGTLRALDPADRERLRSELTDVAAQVARAHGCEARTEITAGEPGLVNEPALAARVAELLPAAGLAPGPALRSCGSDDFGYYRELGPSLMAFVGVTQVGSGHAGLHSAEFLPEDEAVSDVARALAVGYLAAAASE